MLESEIPDFGYSEEDFVLSVQTWHEFSKSPKQSEFDKLLSSRWQMSMDNKVFNYSLSEELQQKRIVPGKENYIIVLNIERVMKRRAPEVIESINQPFSLEKFNFTKIKPEEILMNFCPLDNSVKNCTQSDDVKQTMRGRHQIVINNSPFTFGHCLLLPDVAQCIPQKVTLQGTKLAIQMMLLSSHPGFRVGFNSLCAMASVNHQHLHGWYLNHQLRVEFAPVDQLVGECYQLIDMPSKGFVFQLFGNTVDNLARAVFSVADYFQLNDIAHNVFITRGTLFGEDKDSANTTVRVYLWPRKHYIGQKDIIGKTLTLLNVAVAELAGHIPICFPERFSDLTEAEIVSEVKQAMLPEDKYKQICDDIKLIIQSQQHVNS